MRVKALLVANHCLSEDVFEIGTLKNKDLHGHVLCNPEPITNEAAAAIAADDEFIPDADNDDEDSVLNDSVTATTTTNERPSQSSSAGNSSISRILF